MSNLSKMSRVEKAKRDLAIAPQYLHFHGICGRTTDVPNRVRGQDPVIPIGDHGEQFDGGMDIMAYREEYWKTLAAANPTDAEMKDFMRRGYEETLQLTRMGKQGAILGDRYLALDPDLHPMHTIAAARVEMIQNFVWAYPGLMQWFATDITLAMDEQPYLINETKQEISVTWIGEDGTPIRQRVIRPQARTPIPLYVLSSNAVRYKTFDVYRGDVRERTTSTIDIARDVKINMELRLFGLMNLQSSAGGVFGPFSYENGSAADQTDPELKIWVAHTGIDQTQLPTTNDYDMTQPAYTALNPTANGGLTGFSLQILLAIEDYTKRWSDIFDGGALVPTGEILVPAADIVNIAQTFLPVANALEQRIQEEINRLGYYSVNLYGRNWHFVPSLFIQRGTCYPRFNRQPGIVFSKPGLDREWVDVNIPENWEERYIRKVFGAIFPAQWRTRCMRIKYASISNSSSSVSYPGWQGVVVQGGSQTKTEPYPTIT